MLFVNEKLTFINILRVINSEFMNSNVSISSGYNTYVFSVFLISRCGKTVYWLLYNISKIWLYQKLIVLKYDFSKTRRFYTSCSETWHSETWKIP